MWRVALALVVFLAACSEGEKNTFREVVDNLPLGNIVLNTDTVIVSDQISVQGDAEPFPTRYRCTGRNCTQVNDDPLVEPLIQTASDLLRFTDPAADHTTLPARRGVELSKSTINLDANGTDWTFTNYGAWLNHAAFNNIIGTATVAGVTLQTAYNVSFGDHTETGTNPEGDGVWNGVMLGNTRHTTLDPTIRPLRGDATVNFALATNTLDVAFDNIVYLDTNQSLTDDEISWSGLAVANGSFERRNDDLGHIAGTFYGPDHAEVGGVFTSPSAIGAFGAKREP
ncbi:MAG: hypothetical protein OXE53_01485 [Deltaproteobacteria bacterium]|nr:hypothetical protein [Deltaproteobacteria bacterium]